MQKEDYLSMAQKIHTIEETLSDLLNNKIDNKEAVSLVMSNLSLISSTAFRMLSQNYNFAELKEIKQEEYNLKRK